MESAMARHNKKNNRLQMKVQGLKWQTISVTKKSLSRVKQFHVIFKIVTILMISMNKVHRN